jgi:hypothetical protein
VNDHLHLNLAVLALARAYAGHTSDGVIGHTSGLVSLQWTPESELQGLRERALALPDAGLLHTALPHDEFLKGSRIRALLGISATEQEH